MSWRTDNPYAVTDIETVPPRVVTRYETMEGAQWYLSYLVGHGGTRTREKIERGGYEIRKDGT